MFEPRTIALGQEVELPDGIHVLTDYSKGVMRLRNERTGEYRLVDHLELAQLMPPGRRLQTKEKTKSVIVADAVEGLDDETQLLAQHLEEVLTGKSPFGGEARPEYDPSLPATHRRASKLKELQKAHGIVMDDSSLKRKLKRYREHGPAGLVDRRTQRTETPNARIADEIVTEVSLLLGEYRNKSTPSATVLWALLKRRVAENYPADQQPKMISLSTFKRLVRNLDRSNKTLGSAEERKSTANKPVEKYSALQVSAPGDEAQIDSTTLDVFVRMPDGKVERPILTILIDKRTRSILGFNLTSTAQNAYDHAVLMAHSLVPRPRLPWARRYEELNLPAMPWSEHLTEEQVSQYDVHRPYIIPVRVITDNGRDFLADALRAACGIYGIHVTEAPYASPTSKAIVERAFGTIRSKFCAFLPGYTGGRTEFRGVAPQDEDVLELDTVAALFDRWVAIVYQNRKHDGLIDPFDPSIRHSPNSMYAASISITGHFMLAMEPEDYLALMPRERRNVHADGIEFRGRNYDSPHLGPYREARGPDGKKKKFDIHFDPSDIYYVWLRTPDTDEWIPCEWTESMGLSRPQERRLMSEARRLNASRPGFTDAEADDLMLELKDEVMVETAALRDASIRAQIQRQKEKQAAARPNFPFVEEPAQDDIGSSFTSLPSL